MSTWSTEALTHSRLAVFWNETLDDRPPAEALSGHHEADLVVIGAGFTGLWAALQAVEDNPGRRVVVVEAERVGFGASSRNGGFCEGSLTHGALNGEAHWPDENAVLVAMGAANLDALEESLIVHDIACDFRRSAVLNVGNVPWHVEEMREVAADLARIVPGHVRFLDEHETKTRVFSPTYLCGMLNTHSSSLVNPAQMAAGLADTVRRLGVELFETSPVKKIEQSARRLVVRTPNGTISTERAIVATNAYAQPHRRMRRYVIPVYDHVLVTEPLDAGQLESIGWDGGEGLGDWSNQFHYYRLTADNRILWGGYDATYHYNNGIRPEYDDRPETHEALARHFFETFPQLEGLRFSHRWGGPIGSTTRFTAAWDTAFDGRAAWVAGYTGLGVGASRFGARVALDLVDGLETERTQLEMVRRKPFPFPPEPLRSIGVGITKRALIRADRNGGREGAWLKLLDRFGVGFDS